jgi:hypothetical protein
MMLMAEHKMDEDDASHCLPAARHKLRDLGRRHGEMPASFPRPDVDSEFIFAGTGNLR